MKVKKILSGLLACMLLTACSDQDLQKELEPSEKMIQVEVDVDELTQTYGPALTRSIAHLDGISTYALPSGINAINLIPDGEIPATGETKTIIVSGSFTSVLIRATDAVNATTIREIAVVNSGGMGYGTMVIPAYESTIQGSVRVIIFEYYNNDNNSWEMFNYAIQNAIPVTPFKVWSNIATDIPKEGGNYTINISGDFPSQSSEYIFFQAVDGSNNIVSASTVAIVGNTQKSVSLTIKENTGSNSRIVHLQYRKSTESTFTTFESHVQSNTPTVIPNDFTITHTIPATIPIAGGTYQLTLNGSFGGNRISVWMYDVATNQTLTGTSYLSSTNRTATITIGANQTDGNRQVGLKYNTDQVAAEQVLGTFTQTGEVANNYVIPGTNTLVSKQYALSEGLTGSGGMSYAKANGISETYNSTPWTIGTNKVYNTGCNAYFEKSGASDKGLWRVPTVSELRAMGAANKTLSMYLGVHWAIDRNSNTQSPYLYKFIYFYPDYSMQVGDSDGSNEYSVRCVRERL